MEERQTCWFRQQRLREQYALDSPGRERLFSLRRRKWRGAAAAAGSGNGGQRLGRIEHACKQQDACNDYGLIELIRNRNPKSQAPNPKEAPIFNTQILPHGLEFGAWGFLGIWGLGFGAFRDKLITKKS